MTINSAANENSSNRTQYLGRLKLTQHKLVLVVTFSWDGHFSHHNHLYMFINLNVRIMRRIHIVFSLSVCKPHPHTGAWPVDLSEKNRIQKK